MGIKVRAKELGFYGGQLRYKDDEFTVEDESQLGKWMERVEPSTFSEPIAPRRRRARE